MPRTVRWLTIAPPITPRASPAPRHANPGTKSKRRIFVAYATKFCWTAPVLHEPEQLRIRMGAAAAAAMSCHRVDSSMPAGSVTVYDLEGARIGDVNRNVLAILPGDSPILSGETAASRTSIRRPVRNHHSGNVLSKAFGLLSLRAISPIKATQTIVRHRMIEPTTTTGFFIVGEIMAQSLTCCKD
jgi:hypothetical protein